MRRCRAWLPTGCATRTAWRRRLPALGPAFDASLDYLDGPEWSACQAMEGSLQAVPYLLSNRRHRPDRQEPPAAIHGPTAQECAAHPFHNWKDGHVTHQSLSGAIWISGVVIARGGHVNERCSGF